MVKDIISVPRDIPAVESLAEDAAVRAAASGLARPYLIEIIREYIAAFKADLVRNKNAVDGDVFSDGLITSIKRRKLKKIGRVINGTGILVHTNLGRAPLSEELFDRIKGQITGYGNLEFDVASGKRGKRGELAEKYLALLAGAEAGAIVNNNAAALFLILNTLANRKKVVISRGELVQIGGGFRIPDIIRRSGARLLEIGTTNITSLDDYRAALDEKPAMILKVHQSNFAVKGFTGEAAIKDLIGLGREQNVPVVNDLGSGVFIDTGAFAGFREPTVQDSVRDGADLTCFSGDKLLGGMQAGLIVGRAEMVQKVKRNPVYRAMRVDKTIFSALEELLGYYLDGSWVEHIKLWRLAAMGEAELYKKGQQIIKEIDADDRIILEASEGRIGGGSLPEVPLPSVALVFRGGLSPNRLAALFRKTDPPVIGRVSGENFMIDIKAIDTDDAADLVRIIKSVKDKL